MSASYTKLFSSIVTSTVWMEDNETRILWVTMLALADKDGEVQGSVPGLARVAGITLDGCRAALHKFLSSDPDSRTKDEEGRRIVEIDGGWQLLNYSKYRRMASKEDQVEKATERTRRYRERKASRSINGDGRSTVVHEKSPEAEAEEDIRGNAPTGRSPDEAPPPVAARASPGGAPTHDGQTIPIPLRRMP